MKTIKILFICMVAAIFAHAQESVPPYVMDGVEVTPPKFTAVKYTAPAIENALKTHIAQNFDYKPDFGDALDVITSYSIHYTKLYDLLQKLIPVPLETLQFPSTGLAWEKKKIFFAVQWKKGNHQGEIYHCPL